MPDITMCLGSETIDGKERICPMRTKCYRHTATPSGVRQSYFSWLPLLLDETCNDFLLVAED